MSTSGCLERHYVRISVRDRKKELMLRNILFSDGVYFVIVNRRLLNVVIRVVLGEFYSKQNEWQVNFPRKFPIYIIYLVFGA